MTTFLGKPTSRQQFYHVNIALLDSFSRSPFYAVEMAPLCMRKTLGEGLQCKE